MYNYKGAICPHPIYVIIRHISIINIKERLAAMTQFETNKNDRRDRVFQMLFSLDFNKERSQDETFLSFFDEGDSVPSDGYIRSTFNGAHDFAPEADAMIEKDSKNWSISRMSSVTRTVLRLSIYELLCTPLPPRVAISEGVELAKKYGDENEPAFVNGILNRIAKENGKI